MGLPFILTMSGALLPMRLAFSKPPLNRSGAHLVQRELDRLKSASGFVACLVRLPSGTTAWYSDRPPSEKSQGPPTLVVPGAPVATNRVAARVSELAQALPNHRILMGELPYRGRQIYVSGTCTVRNIRCGPFGAEHSVRNIRCGTFGADTPSAQTEASCLRWRTMSYGPSSLDDPIARRMSGDNATPMGPMEAQRGHRVGLDTSKPAS